MAAWARANRIFSRQFASAAAGQHATTEQTQVLWKRISFFVGFPAIGLAMVNCYLNHQAHHNDPRPEFKFPWGDGNHSLFHNPHANALPDGYEE
ncbi:hypothetical protein PUN28_006067 [Cardiocondyla obscurior]|uniref:Cytochrome c oxidase subunit n=1 Tax=Cardiocondyla obscurior TaxID=286306 RepID=A0AAW2G8Z5_9HYME